MTGGVAAIRDGMSDESYPASADLLVNGKQRKGCGEPATRIIPGGRTIGLRQASTMQSSRQPICLRQDNVKCARPV